MIQFEEADRREGAAFTNTEIVTEIEQISTRPGPGENKTKKCPVER
jgi:hypothetical protein